jgi:hypothetical protein
MRLAVPLVLVLQYTRNQRVQQLSPFEADVLGPLFRNVGEKIKHKVEVRFQMWSGTRVHVCSTGRRCCCLTQRGSRREDAHEPVRRAPAPRRTTRLDARGRGSMRLWRMGRYLSASGVRAGPPGLQRGGAQSPARVTLDGCTPLSPLTWRPPAAEAAEQRHDWTA